MPHREPPACMNDQPLSPSVSAGPPSEAPEQPNPPASPSGDFPGSSNALVELFLQKAHLAAAARLAFSSSDPGFGEFELGLAALRDGNQMASSEGGREPALLLLRSAIRLFARAMVLRRGHAGSDAQWAEVWSIATNLPAWPAVQGSLQQAATAQVVDAITNDEPYLATLSPSARKALLASMTAFAKRLAAPLEHDATLVPRIQWKRRRRLGAVSLFFVALLAWSIVALTRQQNLASNRPVVVSDRDSTFGVDPMHAVDGDRTNLGFHTTYRADATMTIDLGAVKPLHRVDVYNRVDCCQERAVPLALQVSNDGRQYRTLSHTKHKFDLWSVPLPSGTSARFVRLLRERTGIFHLSEVEVY
jgi:hypothetical protein